MDARHSDDIHNTAIQQYTESDKNIIKISIFRLDVEHYDTPQLIIPKCAFRLTNNR